MGVAVKALATRQSQSPVRSSSLAERRPNISDSPTLDLVSPLPEEGPLYLAASPPGPRSPVGRRGAVKKVAAIAPNRSRSKSRSSSPVNNVGHIYLGSLAVSVFNFFDDDFAVT
ncbi:hypothetical protein Tco_0227938 [Tanacetum coccineum]